VSELTEEMEKVDWRRPREVLLCAEGMAMGEGSRVSRESTVVTGDGRSGGQSCKLSERRVVRDCVADSQQRRRTHVLSAVQLLVGGLEHEILVHLLLDTLRVGEPDEYLTREDDVLIHPVREFGRRERLVEA
jgi:hypothetical protein